MSRKFLIEGTTPVSRVIEAEGAADAVATFRLNEPAATIHAIDDEPVIGFCEGCRIPLTDETPYATDGEGVRVCESCQD